MEKRLSLALLLSFLVYIWWVSSQPRPETAEIEHPGVSAPAQEDLRTGYADETSGELTESLVAEQEEEIDLMLGAPGNAGSYRLRLTNKGARLLSLEVGDYFTGKDVARGLKGGEANWIQLLSSIETPQGPSGSLSIVEGQGAKAFLVEPLNEVLWQHRLLENGEGIEFTHAPGTGLVFRKRLEKAAGTYDLRFTFEVENLRRPDAEGLKQFTFTPAEAVRPTDESSRFYQEPQSLAAWSNNLGDVELESAIKKTGGSDLTGQLPCPAEHKLSFAGVHNKFFAFLAAPPTRKEAGQVIDARYRRVKDTAWLLANPEEEEGEAWNLVVCDLNLQVPFPAVGGKHEVVFDLFAGPKQRQILEKSNKAYGAVLDDDIGFFSGVANIITAILSFYQGIVGNWGWAIILMTFTVRAVLFPLNRRAQTAMARFAKKMKRVQPMLDANKEKYKDDQKRQREEQAKIMQKEGAFPPLGGCAPMFLQFPVFIGLFQALRVHFDLRHEPFILWMKDLSEPDRMMELNFDLWLPLIGDFTIPYLNVLPLIMIVLWIAQHKVMPQPESTDPKQAQTRKIMIVMQVFFAFLFYNYASGLALYMMTSSSIAIFESLVIKRVWPIDDAEKEPKKPGRFMAKMAELQKQQQAKMEAEVAQRNKQKKGKGKRK